MKKLFVLIFIAFSISVTLISQVNQEFPAINKEDLPRSKFSPPLYFKGESLFGYIDGGADIYLEYGFSGLTVSQFEYMKGRYKVEIYKMNGPEEAFGIFSISRFHCRQRPAFSTYTCQNKYQLLICSGSYYISIINEAGSKADSAASILIGEKIVAKIAQPAADLTLFFPEVPVETLRNDAKLVKGKLGIVNGVTELEKFFKDATNYTAVILSASDKSLISIQFNNSKALQEFAELHNWRLDNLSKSGNIMSGGILVKKLYDNHIYIEIPLNEELRQNQQ